MICKTVNPKDIEKFYLEYIFTGCAIRSADAVYILARKDLTSDEASDMEDSQIPTRVLMIKENSEHKYVQLGAMHFTSFTRPVLGVSLRPQTQTLLAASDVDGTVLPLGGEKPTWPYESLLPKGLPGCHRLRCIDGYTWAACNRRLVFKRTDIGKWENIRNGFPADMGPLGEVNDIDCGFNDIDGFSSQEIYVVGGKGDIWKYDGKQWSQCGFPTNDYLYTMCCGKDGFVYVGARKGLWKGKNNEWQQVCYFDYLNEMNDLRWFDNKLWLAYDYKLFVWDGKELQDKIIYKDEELELGGFIDSSDDMLLVASSYEVWTYDGKDWYNIIPDFS